MPFLIRVSYLKILEPFMLALLLESFDVNATIHLENLYSASSG